MENITSKILMLILTLLLIFLQYRLWFESDGILDMLRYKKQLASQTDVNEKLKQRNERLLQEVKYLKANKDASIEAHARQDLGMIKKGEVFYQVVK